MFLLESTNICQPALIGYSTNLFELRPNSAEPLQSLSEFRPASAEPGPTWGESRSNCRIQANSGESGPIAANSTKDGIPRGFSGGGRISSPQAQFPGTKMTGRSSGEVGLPSSTVGRCMMSRLERSTRNRKSCHDPCGALVGPKMVPEALRSDSEMAWLLRALGLSRLRERRV